MDNLGDLSEDWIIIHMYINYSTDKASLNKLIYNIKL
jgi:hypothetical protein